MSDYFRYLILSPKNLPWQIKNNLCQRRLHQRFSLSEMTVIRKVDQVPQLSVS